MIINVSVSVRRVWQIVIRIWLKLAALSGRSFRHNWRSTVLRLCCHDWLSLKDKTNNCICLCIVVLDQFDHVICIILVKRIYQYLLRNKYSRQQSTTNAFCVDNLPNWSFSFCSNIHQYKYPNSLPNKAGQFLCHFFQTRKRINIWINYLSVEQCPPKLTLTMYGNESSFI